MKFKNFIAVDLQNDFAIDGGLGYESRPSVDFVLDMLIPAFRSQGIKTSEIVSDYRPPRPGGRGDLCHPGEWGYESIIPEDIKKQPVWVKCMNSPIWVRDGIGDPKANPSNPYQDGEQFQKWLDGTVGPMNSGIEVVLFGLTVDCCVLSTAQELNWRGYKVYILKEAVDTYSGDAKEKEWIINNPPLLNWAKVISWEDVIKNI